MAFDKELADRIRDIVAPEPGLTEKKMFGGLAFLLNGHMAVSASSQGGLMLRVDPARTDELVAQPQVGRVVMRGREMDGWLRVDKSVVDTEQRLTEWVGLGVAYARTLAPK
jgi:TfoX/Sxy family transcriptional regulator of competence genes